MVIVFGSPAPALVPQRVRAWQRTTARTRPFLKLANELTEEGRKRGRTAAGQQRNIRGNESSLAPRLDENGRRLGPDHGNRRIRAMNLPVGEQGDSAFVVPVRRVRMNQRVQPGENHHRLKQQEDTQPQARLGLLRLP